VTEENTASIYPQDEGDTFLHVDYLFVVNLTTLSVAETNGVA
jgi:hypothetical protein